MRPATAPVFLIALLAACSAEVADKDRGSVAIEVPSPPSTVAEHREQLDAVDKALARDPGNPEYIAWARSLNSITDGWAGLVATVQTEAGNTVSLFEPSPGTFMVREELAPGSVGVVGTQGWETLGELYAAIKPGAPLPEAIAVSDARQRARKPKTESVTSLEDGPERAAGDPLIPKHGTSSCAHFRDTHAGCPAAPDDGSWCVCNITGDSWGGRNGMTHAYQHVSAYTGNISVNIIVNNSSFGYAVLQGEIRTYETHSVTAFTDCSSSWGTTTCALVFQPRYHGGEVVNAAGDSYHWGACFDAENRAAGWDCPIFFTPPFHDQ